MRRTRKHHRIIFFLLLCAGLFGIYSFFSCGTDYWLKLDLSCPASWIVLPNVPKKPLSKDQINPSFKPINSGTYVLYQVTRQQDQGTETTIFRQNLSEINNPTSLASFLNDGLKSFVSQVYGKQVFVRDVSSAESENMLVNLDGSQKKETISPFAVSSSDGKRQALSTFHLGTNQEPIEVDVSVVDSETGKDIDSFILDSKQLGILNGYAIPFLFSADHNVLYIHQVSEGQEYVTGLWAYDFSSHTVRSYPYVSENHLYRYQINPMTQQLIGTSFTLPESLDEFPKGPSTLHLVDLQTGKGIRLSPEDLNNPNYLMDDTVFDGVFLSPDGTQIGLSSEKEKEFVVLPLNGGDPLKKSVAEGDGFIRDWVQDTLVVNQEGDILLYDLTTQKIIPLARNVGKEGDPDYQRVEYIGIIVVQ
ncbi:MAG: hypothetical protein UU48_C0002G0058 [Candidatus Uhrbacteria bacterium GW2011_GWF2_41_16]|uniref:Lipoprotein n=2 Tax=Candidatus Uhriibacteriota TaxID=1752732 RepID=A0A0G0VC50_9BACT|nr:MAG: hypothetical protein UU31_C0003G0066 [Candidatus Uhrbacteria bacterium GW2011_GWA2_41_10]KKR87543.1 MAG: hypothetical protein UU35_C0002G0044 [Candidatus Uhrbacteria bacterium GW2011_GWC2_41_11]KKR98523.1 MAG: hypothetical protein UU48_C0002G0058 [Candidatus Uhrbacteria bacterium GW2011_GWF2_41_16]HBO99940.1 hypothetical protein [Candidatus Uhrbacteria bacterium]